MPNTNFPLLVNSNLNDGSHTVRGFMMVGRVLKNKNKSWSKHCFFCSAIVSLLLFFNIIMLCFHFSSYIMSHHHHKTNKMATRGEKLYSREKIILRGKSRKQTKSITGFDESITSAPYPRIVMSCPARSLYLRKYKKMRSIIQSSQSVGK